MWWAARVYNAHNIRRKGAPLSLAGRQGLHSACLSAIIVALTQSMKKIDFFLRRHGVHTSTICCLLNAEQSFEEPQRERPLGHPPSNTRCETRPHRPGGRPNSLCEHSFLAPSLHLLTSASVERSPQSHEVVDDGFTRLVGSHLTVPCQQQQQPGGRTIEKGPTTRGS